MIISCTNCNKNFEVDDNLIPKNGRLVQCSSCLHKWHFSPPKKIRKEKIIETHEDKKEIIKKIYDKPIKEDSNETDQDILITDDIKDDYEKDIKKIKKTKNISFINLLLVLIISFIALVVIIDTFKFQLINIYPKTELYLNSLYETLKDITSFFKDLF